MVKERRVNAHVAIVITFNVRDTDHARFRQRLLNQVRATNYPHNIGFKTAVAVVYQILSGFQCRFQTFRQPHVGAFIHFDLLWIGADDDMWATGQRFAANGFPRFPTENNRLADSGNAEMFQFVGEVPRHRIVFADTARFIARENNTQFHNSSVLM
ncbi:hypothetical protein D3C80_1450110 [compost metagenome]